MARAFVEVRPLQDAIGSLGSLDWDATVARAEHERLAPLLYVALRDVAPAPVLSRLRTAWMAAERQLLLAGAQLREILEAFGQVGVETIVLKGPALAGEY